MTRKRSLAGVVAAVVLTVVGVAGVLTASASVGNGNEQLLGPHEIVGTWRATVNRGPVLPPVRSLQVFTRGGSIVESGSDSLYRSSAFGVWEYVGDRTYATTQVFHRFSPTGEYLGTHEINGNRQLSPDGDSYTAVAIGTFRDPDGNVIATLPPVTAVATRMHVERIPNLP